jgi:hypothetical protein
MDSRISFTEQIDVTVGKALSMLGFVKRLPSEFRDSYTLKKPEYANCVWLPFYDVHVDRIECVQRKFVRYALQELGWMDMNDIHPYEDRCVLIECMIRCCSCVTHLLLLGQMTNYCSCTDLWLVGFTIWHLDRQKEVLFMYKLFDCKIIKKYHNI